jgi:hypothetical protein
MPGKSAINLLPKTEFETSFWGRFLKWALTAGRYIIILTEMVVILAFLSRFKFDKDLLDLNESIAGKKNILEATYQIEQNFRSAQTRINLAKEILSAAPTTTELLDKITSAVPVGMSLQSINVLFSTRQITVSAAANSEQAIGQYMSALANDKTWKKTEVQNIQNTTTGINFILSLEF